MRKRERRHERLRLAPSLVVKERRSSRRQAFSKRLVAPEEHEGGFAGVARSRDADAGGGEREPDHAGV